ncbi:hypothetical protein GALMADRAFT_133867 [Galerina marginata CBS 339.88]|uniref:Uncharacterized protein n=1 Tax=Galerina marginata (strain CBS 339.88) TaxID=685588 RepID=A0A067TN16_GALM3|nr:hypothetical protein GALMADRAFT_133867 [Galerina marginata CBS 339.88]
MRWQASVLADDLQYAIYVDPTYHEFRSSIILKLWMTVEPTGRLTSDSTSANSFISSSFRISSYNLRSFALFNCSGQRHKDTTPSICASSDSFHLIITLLSSRSDQTTSYFSPTPAPMPTSTARDARAPSAAWAEELTILPIICASDVARCSNHLAETSPSSRPPAFACMSL